MVNTERHLFDALRIGTVEADQIIGFDPGVGKDHVGASDRRRLGQCP